MNKVILCGRLTADPDVKTSKSDLLTARYNLAVNRAGRSDESDFIPCVAFGKNAEFAQKYMSKGVRMLIEGRIQSGSYVNNNGDTVRTMNVIVDHHEFADAKKDARKQETAEDEFMQVTDDVEDFPF